MDLKNLTAKKVEPDDIEKLILKWRERVERLTKEWNTLVRGSPLFNTYAVLVEELERCADELELAYIGPDPADPDFRPEGFAYNDLLRHDNETAQAFDKAFDELQHEPNTFVCKCGATAEVDCTCKGHEG